MEASKVKPDHQEVKWGILSTAKIGREQVIPAMQRGEYSSVHAIASRDQKKAEQVASDLDIPHAYGSYEELLGDPNVEAVYNPLPNHLHIPWTLKALEAGKHVLCEKPLGMDASEVQELKKMMAQYPDLQVMEAFMYKFHPQWVQVQSWLGKNAIGELKSIHTTFCYYNDDPSNIRNFPEMGGGALMDIGCYGISVARLLFRDEPQKVKGIMESDPKMGVDTQTSGILHFTKGHATFHCSTRSFPFQEVRIMGTKGRIVVPIPFNPGPDQNTTLQLTIEGETEEIQVPASGQYTRQGDIFSKAILDGRKVPVSLKDALGNMKVIDAIKRDCLS